MNIVSMLRRWCHAWWFRVFAPLLIGAVIRGIVSRIGFDPPGGTWGDVGFFVIYYFFGLFIVNIPSISFVTSLLPDMWRIDALAKPPTRSEIIDFAKRDMQGLLKRTAGVLGPTGELMSESDVDEFTKRCFRLGTSTYYGVERHLPTIFYQRYPGYLDAHDLNLSKNPGKQSARILLATRAALREDYQKDPEAYSKFYNWHHTRNVALLHVLPRMAQQLADDLRLKTTDVGIWPDQYALLFQPEAQGTSAVLNMVPKGSPAFTNCVKYFESLKKNAKEVANPPQLVDRNIAENWEAYVNPSRRHSKLAPILFSYLGHYKERGVILDAAAGVGCESVFLKEEGFNVVSNEIEENFREAAKRYAHNHGVTLRPLDNHNWLELSRHYQAVFEAVLVLGNSLCLVTQTRDRRTAIEEFFSVLKPGGILIIDERNFRYIVRNAEKIMKNPPLNSPFGRSMYHGITVRGCPVDIEEGKVTWACYKNEPNVRDWPELQQNIIGEFELYPFKDGELEKLLTDCGFEIIARYYDLENTPDPNAEFITYVARKP